MWRSAGHHRPLVTLQVCDGCFDPAATDCRRHGMGFLAVGGGVLNPRTRNQPAYVQHNKFHNFEKAAPINELAVPIKSNAPQTRPQAAQSSLMPSRFAAITGIGCVHAPAQPMPRHFAHRRDGHLIPRAGPPALAWRLQPIFGGGGLCTISLPPRIAGLSQAQ
jgi:hypothetical protein